MNTAYLLLGSNLDDRPAMLLKARKELANRVGHIVRESSVYVTEPWGFSADKPFLNQVIKVLTELDPESLLLEILRIEMDLGRKRTVGISYSSRCIDIDILFFNDEIIKNDDLVIPHPGIPDRMFTLVPLAELDETLVHPETGKTVSLMKQECLDNLKVEVYSDARKMDLKSLKYNYITIEGCIGAGKTTLAKRISEDFNARLILERFEDNSFLPKFYEQPDIYAFPLEMSFLADRYQQLKDKLSMQELFSSFTISDYFIDKSLIFARNNLKSDEFNLYSRLFQIISNFLPRPDLLVYLYLDIPRLMQNIKKRGRDYELSIQPDYLEKIQAGYLNHFRSMAGMRILIVDTSKVDFMFNGTDYEAFLDLIGREYDSGIHRIFL